MNPNPGPADPDPYLFQPKVKLYYIFSQKMSNTYTFLNIENYDTNDIDEKDKTMYNRSK
jgi:hypothetical protein